MLGYDDIIENERMRDHTLERHGLLDRLHFGTSRSFLRRCSRPRVETAIRQSAAGYKTAGRNGTLSTCGGRVDRRQLAIRRTDRGWTIRREFEKSVSLK